MRRLRPFLGVVVLLAAATVACGDVTLPSPDSADMKGETWDDTQQLPDSDVIVRLAGVRVDVMDGPKAGSFAISDADGRYELRDMPVGPVPVQLRATKDGYDPATATFTFAVSYISGSSSRRVGDFRLISDRIEHASEDLEAQVLLVA